MMELGTHLVFLQLSSANLTYLGPVTEQEVWRVRANLEPKELYETPELIVDNVT
jgi:hypothetical protein